jgi:HAD superfamily hydrolase (TIGR01490 family)
MYVAFFDLDHTILSTSSGRVMFRGSYEHGIIGKKEIRRGLIVNALYRLGLMSAGTAVGRWMKWYGGLELEKVAPLGAEWADELKKYVREDARREVAFHRERGARTVLLSASPAFICEKMREHLGMSDSICTELDVADGCLTGKLKGEYCHGREKLVRARRYCGEFGLRMEDAYYYADSIADLYVLEAVGHPVCVTPDRGLQRQARKRGWKIVRW